MCIRDSTSTRITSRLDCTARRRRGLWVGWGVCIFVSRRRPCLKVTELLRSPLNGQNVPDRYPSPSQKVSVRPVRQTGTMLWSPTWLDLMPSISSSSFQVSLSSFDAFKCTFWARTDKQTYTHTHTHKAKPIHPCYVGCNHRRPTCVSGFRRRRSDDADNISCLSSASTGRCLHPELIKHTRLKTLNQRLDGWTCSASWTTTNHVSQSTSTNTTLAIHKKTFLLTNLSQRFW